MFASRASDCDEATNKIIDISLNRLLTGRLLFKDDAETLFQGIAKSCQRLTFSPPGSTFCVILPKVFILRGLNVQNCAQRINTGQQRAWREPAIGKNQESDD